MACRRRWAIPPVEASPPPDPLFHPDADQLWEMKQIFAIADKNRSGGLSLEVRGRKLMR